MLMLIFWAKAMIVNSKAHAHYIESDGRMENIERVLFTSEISTYDQFVNVQTKTTP